MVVLVRLAAVLHPGLEVTTAIAWLGVISMTFGNLCALAQKDVKRMLGFSSVAHAGYVTVGLVSGTAEGLAAAAFYALVYVVMNLLCFWVVARVAVDGRNLVLSDLNGLHRRSPVLAFALGVGAFALVGLPPTAGFMGKLFLITAAWNHGYNWLVIALALNSAIAIYYYLSLVRHAYTEPDEKRLAARARPERVQPGRRGGVGRRHAGAGHRARAAVREGGESGHGPLRLGAVSNLSFRPLASSNFACHCFAALIRKTRGARSPNG